VKPCVKYSGYTKARRFWSEFADAQKALSLKQGDEGMPVAEICRKAAISQETYFN